MRRMLKQDGLAVGGQPVRVYNFMGNAEYYPPLLDRWVNLDTYNRLIRGGEATAQISRGWPAVASGERDGQRRRAIHL